MKKWLKLNKYKDFRIHGYNNEKFRKIEEIKEKSSEEVKKSQTNTDSSKKKSEGHETIDEQIDYKHKYIQMKAK